MHRKSLVIFFTFFLLLHSDIYSIQNLDGKINLVESKNDELNSYQHLMAGTFNQSELLYEFSVEAGIHSIIGNWSPILYTDINLTISEKESNHILYFIDEFYTESNSIFDFNFLINHYLYLDKGIILIKIDIDKPSAFNVELNLTLLGVEKISLGFDNFYEGEEQIFKIKIGTLNDEIEEVSVKFFFENKTELKGYGEYNNVTFPHLYLDYNTSSRFWENEEFFVYNLPAGRYYAQLLIEFKTEHIFLTQQSLLINSSLFEVKIRTESNTPSSSGFFFLNFILIISILSYKRRKIMKTR